MLDRRAGTAPEHLIELWAKLQTVMDAVFFKPFGWDGPSAYLASAFQRMSEHGKSRRKPYRDAYMENLLRRKKEMPPWLVLRRSTPQQQRQRQEQLEPDSDGLWAVFLDRRAPARDRNLALFAVLGRQGSS
ncbi:hypothetical protein EXIGLDRAFT_847181 [Exidia glandulosa HHB12029]|uniref:Uncharacterized protein n=1 Tax=Exidia glandulosa HHB12029 TaxID=1314781 RepID=A0A166N4Y5_EXIGL|nr:hypothetical protein EXIGLDRAFT_847181 [Exidia glandulosa HHB12029]